MTEYIHLNKTIIRTRMTTFKTRTTMVGRERAIAKVIQINTVINHHCIWLLKL